MFEIGFSELCMVALVALLVIGPEKLPQAARIAGFWIGKTRRMVASVQAEIKQEFHAEEFCQAVKDHTDFEEFHDLVEETSDAIYSIKSSVEKLPKEKTTVTKQHEPE